MYNPTHVQLKYWFYPTGNTPAVNLLRDLVVSEGDEDINILSLACGDPRSILFSLWCEQECVSKRQFNFTCCDIEPAVLARNVVLFTLIADIGGNDLIHNDVSAIWNLFYHLLIPGKSLAILRTHAARLLEASRNGIESWASSPYGGFSRFVDKATLEQLRGYWSQYGAAEGPDTQATDFRARAAMSKRNKEIETMSIISGVRAAGPFWLFAMDVMSRAYGKYWETGVVGGNAKDIALLGNGQKGLINPMFAVSSAPAGDFAVHYGTEPLMGFNLAEMFQRFASGQEGDVNEKVNRVVELAKTQFSSWCRCFRDCINKNRVCIDLFCGEALGLSHELQIDVILDGEPSQLSRIYTKPWSSSPMVFDKRKKLPRKPFDVIDTSNLGDHVGLINVLSAVAPLLRHNVSAVLYTESLLRASENIETSLSSLLGLDVATFSFLIGLAPVGLITGVTMEAVSNEAAMSVMTEDKTGGMTQYRMRIPWKSPEFGDPVVLGTLSENSQQQIQPQFDPKALAGIFFEVYKSMFTHEDTSKLLSRMLRMQQQQFSTDQPRYTRAGMVALLRLAKVRISTDWEEAMNGFLEHVTSDRSMLVGSNSLQELWMHLHISRLWSSDALLDGPRQLLPKLPLRSPSEDVGLLAETEVPAVVTVVLIVPREKLKVFTGRHVDSIGTPGLHFSIAQRQGAAQFENSYFSFGCFFGKVIHKANSEGTFNIQEDDHAWLGTADLVVCCQVPTFGLLLGPRDGITAALIINTSPETAARFSPELGMRMVVFETGLKDKRRFFVCHDAPKLSTQHANEMQKKWIEDSTTSRQSSLQTLVKLNSERKATHLQTHIDFPHSSAESKALSTGGSVTVNQYSTNTVMLRIGPSLKRRVAFIFPMQGSRAKVRVARKSSWVEIEVPISTALNADPWDSWTQVVTEKGCPPICWSIPRVNLKVQPEIFFAKGAESTWIRSFLGASLSDAESAHGGPGGSTSDKKLDLKQSLNVLFASFAGINKQVNGKSIKTFHLARKNSCHTLILVHRMRHDLDLGSLVLEAYVVPLTIPRVHELQSTLAKIQELGPCSINVSDEESLLWKRMFPALAERCRTWSHRSACEYKRKPPPLSTEDGESPLCKCGEGKISSAELGKVVKVWGPLAKYATRIAIAPIFPVPYVEASMSEFKKMRSKISKAQSSPKGNNRETLSSCANCTTSVGPLKTCSGCGKVRYCGPACQKADWKEHKKACTRG